MALETSTRRGSVALGTGRAVFEADLAEGRSHAADLLPELERLSALAGIPPPGKGGGSFESIVVGTGPGSYTGLRVGMATALGLARATGARLLGLPSIEALAFEELSPGEEASILLDARANLFYFARYRREERDLTPLVPPCAVTATEIEERLPPRGLVLGGGVAVEELGHSPHWRDRLRIVVPRARALLALGRRRMELGAAGSLELEPLYLMAPPARPGGLAPPSDLPDTANPERTPR